MIRCNHFKKGTKTMISIAGGAYPTDDKYFSCDTRSNDALLIYDLGDTQPWMSNPEYVDTDHYRKIMNSAKITGNKKKFALNFNPNNLMKILTAVAIVGGIVYGILANGGIKI